MDWYHVLLLLFLLAHAIGSGLIYTRVIRLLADISATSATITGAAEDLREYQGRRGGLTRNGND